MNYDPASPDLSTASDGRVSLDATLLKSLRKTRGLSQEALAELCMARHLATILDTDLDALLDSAAAPPAPAAATPPVAAGAPHSDSVRYVIELHLLLGAPPSESARRDMLAACTRFGGALRQADTARPVAIFGLPQAFRSDAERALRCALALRKTLLVHGGRALALRLARSTNGVADAGPLLPALAAGADPLALPIHVARALAGQLDGHYRFEAGDADWTRFAGAGAGEA